MLFCISLWKAQRATFEDPNYLGSNGPLWSYYKLFMQTKNGCRLFHDYTRILCVVVIKLRVSWSVWVALYIVAIKKAHAVSRGYIITLSALILGAISRSIENNIIQFTIRHAEVCVFYWKLRLNLLFSNGLMSLLMLGNPFSNYMQRGQWLWILIHA